jgi:hypothetical protein
MNEYKKSLTKQERIKCAYLFCVRNVAMQDLAIAYEVNIGRVSEAIAAIETAADNPLGTIVDEAARLPRMVVQ